MWERFGYRVERYSIAPGAAQLLRRVYAPSGEMVMDAAGYDAELAYCRALDINASAQMDGMRRLMRPTRLDARLETRLKSLMPEISAGPSF